MRPDPCYSCGRLPRLMTDGARSPLAPEIIEHHAPPCPNRFTAYRKQRKAAIKAWNTWNKGQRDVWLKIRGRKRRRR